MGFTGRTAFGGKLGIKVRRVQPWWRRMMVSVGRWLCWEL